jgi:hypothetical protein
MSARLSRRWRCNKMLGMQRILIVTGAILLLAGVAWPWLSKLGLGRLPGDIRVESESGGFYFPIVTCLVISAVLSLVVWWLRR